MTEMSVELCLRTFSCFLCQSPQHPRNTSRDEFGIQLAKYTKVLNILNFPHSLPKLNFVRSKGENCCWSCFQGLSQLWDFHELILSIQLEMKEIVQKLTPQYHKQTINDGNGIISKPPSLPPPALVPLNQQLQFQETTNPEEQEIISSVVDFEAENEEIADEPFEELEMKSVKLENMDDLEYDENEMDDLLDEEEQKAEIPSGCTVSVTLPKQNESLESPSNRPSRSSKTKAISLIRMEAVAEQKLDYQEDTEYRPEEENSNDEGMDEIIVERRSKRSFRRRKRISSQEPRTCDICGMLLSNTFCFNRHREVVHKIKPVKATAPFPSFRHRVHPGRPVISRSKRWTCNICGIPLSNGFCLRRHRSVVHGTEEEGIPSFSPNHSCSKCLQKFPSASTLYHHILHFHSEEREGKGPNKSQTVLSFKCTKCWKTFRSDTSLKKHFSQAHRGVQFKMPPTEDKQKEVENEGEERIICNICAIPFKSEQSLKIHRERVHEKIKSHFCNICKKGFYLRVTLNNHIRTHWGEKPFQCNHCLRNFTSLQGLGDHRNKHHKDNDVDTLD